MTATDQRLIEDYIPIEAISAEARREKSIRKGHISTLHLWWARRPLVAARAAVYGALVPATAGKQKDKDTPPTFVADLCKYPGSPSVIAEARRHILEAHAARLTAERERRRAQPWSPPRTSRPAARRGRACWTCSPAAARSRWRRCAWAARRTRST